MQISAKVIQDSFRTGLGESNCRRITTFELEYPRFIHSELMTHRLFSRNAASSRAIPVANMIRQVQENPAMPIHWGMNQPGMQAQFELSECLQRSSQYLWKKAAKSAARIASALNKMGLHKQVVNRLLEPFQMMKTVVTATELDNFFYLRLHKDAQPEIKALADAMYEALLESNFEVLWQDEWHVPYVKRFRDKRSGKLRYEDCNGQELSVEDAIKVSASCCAQVSYRKNDETLEKALVIYDRLVDTKPVHASPFEHQATPMVRISDNQVGWEDGVTHLDKHGDLWSGNFRGFIQHRQLIEGHVCNEFYGPEKEGV
ncbi:thymidylate synthase [Pseudomonas phage PT07]|nr:thymidylate synthase [Pseudomonas phage PT07]